MDGDEIERVHLSVLTSKVMAFDRLLQVTQVDRRRNLVPEVRVDGVGDEADDLELGRARAARSILNRRPIGSSVLNTVCANVLLTTAIGCRVRRIRWRLNVRPLSTGMLIVRKNWSSTF